ncbi:MAG: DUF3619 family protein [Candidatus Nitricoxidivorans perseverans]|uniref:DUF3619 family protein n=1 Tax=Candidatus Nitricoxidivorans perseverans TaxID=2975601 RepID=A0AA49FL73_9PROT|nr:MAG: DUF3619 family protein [Candidatus Nitricoxidivorans perseverans]
MNEEFRIASQICRVLDHGVEGLPSAVTSRLREARQGALAHQRATADDLITAGVGNGSRGFPVGRPYANVRILLAALALMIGAAGTYQWNQFQKAAEHAEIDSALLADEIPFNAYLDQDFLKWLDNLAQEQEAS